MRGKPYRRESGVYSEGAVRHRRSADYLVHSGRRYRWRRCAVHSARPSGLWRPTCKAVWRAACVPCPLEKCAVCAATVLAEVGLAGRAGSTTVCTNMRHDGCRAAVCRPRLLRRDYENWSPYPAGDAASSDAVAIRTYRCGVSRPALHARRPADCNSGHRSPSPSRIPMRPGQTTRANCRTPDKTSY
jgi:hypothetical protein